MINDLESIDWASMSHAYGPAGDVPVGLRSMVSRDPEVREKALGDFYSAAHHQGDVYSCTVASLPFLFALADEPATPDRASIVELLLSIGRAAAERSDGIHFAPDGTESTAGADSVAFMRERVDTFIACAADQDPRIRCAGIEAVGLFLDDADRAVALLRDRLPSEDQTAERVRIVRTAADVALRLPAARAAATAWLDALAEESTGEADIRLAALVHQARCSAAAVDAATVSTAVDLLRRLTPAPAPQSDGEGCRGSSGACACTAEAEAPSTQDAPPQIAAAFADLERHNRVHAPTTPLLTTFHSVLDTRLTERTALLTEQLRSRDPGTRYDAIRMAKELITSWRGDHTGLIRLLAACLLPEDPYTAAAAAETLGSLAPVSEPAREALAAYVAAHEPGVWGTPKPLLRRTHQEAVMALARLGDLRALPSLLTALDTGIDTWRAVQVCVLLPTRWRRGCPGISPRSTSRSSGPP
ncbi:HEAT repeat domain-containing protein [Streptomyces sp. NPDC017890]|uniref:HEAT repeat domain-containing protein n=1 Tax=Streptomyces sp. NPDC017890 TaxID=3365015 RepID=UPI0037A19B6B